MDYDDNDDDLSDDDDNDNEDVVTPVQEGVPDQTSSNAGTPTVNNTAPQNEDVLSLEKIGNAIKEVKQNAPNALLPHLNKLEASYLSIRRKVMNTKKRLMGFSKKL